MRPTARSVAGLLLLVAVLAGVLAGCSSDTATSSGLPAEVALKVDDWTLSKADFVDELQQVAKNTRYVDARTQANGGKPFEVFKAGTTDPDPAVASEFLNERVSFRMAQDELRRRNITVTDADRQQAIGLLGASLKRAQAQAAGSTTTTAAAGEAPSTTAVAVTPETVQLGQAVLDGFPGSYKQVLLDGVSSLVALQRELLGGGGTEQQIRQLYESTKDEACVSHILVKPNANAGKADPQTGQPIIASDAEYQAALLKATELRAKVVGGAAVGGADFATVAQESSDDAGTKEKGGDLGCRPRRAYVQAFDDVVWQLPLNTVSEPVKTDFGYHVIVVREKRTSTFDEARPALEQAVQAAQGEKLQEWLTQATQKAKVDVSPAYGVWDPVGGTVRPATGAPGPNVSLAPLDSAPAAPGTTR